MLSDLSKLSIRVALWIDYKWDVKYCENQSELRLFVPRPNTRSLGMGLPRPAWVRLNHLCTGVGRFQSSMHKWGLSPTSICECGTLDQTASHLILECSLHGASRGYHRLLVLADEARCWLNNIATNI